MNAMFVTGVLATAFLQQVTVMIIRVTATYRADELGLSVFWVGLLATSFSLLPLPLTVAIGRYVDRGNDAKAVWLCSAGAIFCSLLIIVTHSAFGLLAGVTLLGVCQMTIGVALQILCARDDRPGVLEKMIGNYMVANAVGQGVGSLIIGFAGSGVAVPPTQKLFWIALCSAAVQSVIAHMLRPGRATIASLEGSRSTSLPELFRLPGFLALLAAGLFSSAAQDLIFVFMPLIGKAHDIRVEDVGRLLAVFTGSSMMARLTFARLYQRLGTRQLAAISVLVSGFGYGCVGLPLPLHAMYVVVALIGFGSGIALTTTIAGLISHSPPEIRGRANSLRLAANRVALAVFPFFASLIATAVGIGSVFVLVGVLLASSGAMISVRPGSTPT
jgi:MFS family permease